MEGDKACSSISEGIDFNGRVHQSLGFSSPVGKNLSRKTLHHGLQSSLHSKQFLQLDDRLHPFPARNITTTSFSLRKSRGSIVAAGKQGWDFGRFLKTVYFFNEPPSPAKFFEFLIAKLSSSTSSESVKEMGTTDIILVAGATGGVGRRVVDVLRKKGIPVRALGKVPLISGVGINQLHIFIFVLAVTHVLYCIITLVVGRLKVHLASVDMEDAMVRGKGCPWFCIVSQNLSVLNLVIVKKGENDLPGLIEESRIRRELQRPSRGSCKLVISEDVMVVGRESLLENELWEGSCFYVS